MQVAALILMLALGGEPANGSIEPIPSPAGEGSLAPWFATDDRGEVILSWVQEGEESAFCFALWDAEAARFSAPRRIARGEGWFVNWADVPAVTAFPDGTLAAHWLVKSGEATYAYEVRFSLSRDRGETWSEPRVLHEDRSETEHGFVSWTRTSEPDELRAIWLSGRDDGSGTALMSRTVERTGVLGAESVIDGLVCDCCSTALTRVEDELWAVWRDRSPNEFRDLSFARFADGSWTPPRGVRPDGWEIFGCPVNGPAIAARGEDVVLGWYTGAGGGAGQVMAAFRRGDAFGPARRLDEGAPVGRVAVALLEDGDAVVAWLEVEEGAAAAWRLRRVPRRGQPGESIVLARTTSGRATGFARLARVADGLLFAWTEPGPPPQVRTAWISLETGPDEE